MTSHESHAGSVSQPDTPEGEMNLSPSEAFAHNSAVRVSGQRSTQKALASVVLGFELIIVVLMGLSLFGLSITDPKELGLVIGGSLAVLIICALALMRHRVAGVWLGWFVHACMFAMAFLLPVSVIVSVLFTALWVYCMVTGARIDRQRLQAQAQAQGQSQ